MSDIIPAVKFKNVKVQGRQLGNVRIIFPRIYCYVHLNLLVRNVQKVCSLISPAVFIALSSATLLVSRTCKQFFASFKTEFHVSWNEI